MTRIAIFISGRGSNMAALIEAAQRGKFSNAEIALVLSNRPQAPGLRFAEQAGIRTVVVDHTLFGNDREAHEVVIDVMLRHANIDLICLAGYMRILSAGFIDVWKNRILNIHPSLLPDFPGLHTHARALAAGVKVHGCTVHLATSELDDGPVIAQATVPVLPTDDESTLDERVLKQEHLLYVRAVQQFLDTPDRWRG